MKRIGEVKRITKETDIFVEINIDGTGVTDIDTGIGLFDHMLTLLGVHGGLDLKVKANGDLEVDGHHTVEDVGIALGRSIAMALGDKKSINRYGTCYMPMDEALSRVVLDLSSRPFLVMNTDFSTEKVGNMDTELFEEFFRGLAFNAGITLHIETLYGKNNHHIAESLFKGFGHAFKQAIRIDPDRKGVLSSKGTF